MRRPPLRRRRSVALRSSREGSAGDRGGGFVAHVGAGGEDAHDLSPLCLRVRKRKTNEPANTSMPSENAMADA